MNDDRAELKGLLFDLEDALSGTDDDRQHRLALVGLSVASLAHELRNRLSVIRGFAELARRGSPERAQNLASEIERVAVSAADRLESYLDLASARALPPVDLRTLAEDVAHLARPLGVAREIQVTANLGQVPYVEVDPTGLRPALLDLVLNAVGHAKRQVAVGLAYEDGTHVVTVDDDGPGFGDSGIPGDFKLFASKRPGGTGLGLVSAAKLVAQAGGTLTAEAGPLGGARFVVRLRIAGRDGATPA